MTTKQNDAAALTDEQVDAVSGGPHYTTWSGKSLSYRNRSASLVSAQPLLLATVKKGLASSPLGLQGNYVGVVGEPRSVW